jgi:hypothetical protein
MMQVWDVLEEHSGTMFVVYTSWLIACHYIELLKATQANSPERIDNCMGPLYTTLMCTGHFNVAEQVINNCYDDATLKPELLAIKKKHQVARVIDILID